MAAATRPLAGRDKVLAFFQVIYAKRSADVSLETVEINRAPAWLIPADGEIQVVFDFLVVDGQIVEIRAIRNPDKLRHLTGGCDTAPDAPSNHIVFTD